MKDLQKKALELILDGDVQNFNGFNEIYKDSILEFENLTFKHLDLKHINLKNVKFIKCSFHYCDFNGAKLNFSTMTSCKFNFCDLYNTYFELSFIFESSFNNCDLSGANFNFSNLELTNFYYCNLEGITLKKVKNLSPDMVRDFKKDLLYVLSNFNKEEVAGLKLALLEGKIDGTSYSGECACLVGTLSSHRDYITNDIDVIISLNIPFYKKGLHNLSELLFLQIRPNETPEDNQFSKIALEVIDYYLNLD